MNNLNLDVVFHVNGIALEEQNHLTSRFYHAGQWVLQRFILESMTVSISVVDDHTIKRLNAEYLQHHWETDVVSFVFDPAPRVNGEIIASWTTAERMSVRARWSTSDEMLLYILHGMLHLAGLDDIEPDERLNMRHIEREYLISTALPGAEYYLERFDQVADELE